SFPKDDAAADQAAAQHELAAEDLTDENTSDTDEEDSDEMERLQSGHPTAEKTSLGVRLGQTRTRTQKRVAPKKRLQ
ncbi:hypothetical protein LSAT2_006649, partial [Lamellibrachia satsuma]